MSDTPKMGCAGCSACCLHVGSPPFLLDLKNGSPAEIDGEDSRADHQRLLAAPPEAQAAYIASLKTNDLPCAWLDVDDKRCRYYNFRPDICRAFEIGGKWCSQLRGLHQIG